MGKFIDLTGQTFGRWTVIRYAGVNKQGNNALWLCRCSCAAKTETVVLSPSLRRGLSKSCGCLKRELCVKRSTKHGLSRKHPAELNAWSSARQRCTNPNDAYFEDYGGRDIGMAPEWVNDFPAFLAHIGPRPSPKHSLDRIDNDRGYEPGNVRWATKKEQTANRRPSRANITEHNKWDTFRRVLKALETEDVFARMWSEAAPSTPRLVAANDNNPIERAA